jgi:hypothetical protein
VRKACAECIKRITGEAIGELAATHRIGFIDFVQVARLAKTMPLGDWAVHAIPTKWNYKSIDGIHLYVVGGVLYVIGNSISVQTAQEHNRSLAWVEELEHMHFALQRTWPNPQFVLLFTGKQADDRTVLRGEKRHVDAIVKLPCKPTIMDFPLNKAVGETVCDYMGIDTTMVTYGARVLSVEYLKKAKEKKGKESGQGRGIGRGRGRGRRR